jgi:hypothetical protein
MIRVVHPVSGSLIRILTLPIPDPGSRGEKGTRSRIPDPGPQHCLSGRVPVNMLKSYFQLPFRDNKVVPEWTACADAPVAAAEVRPERLHHPLPGSPVDPEEWFIYRFKPQVILDLKKNSEILG